MRILNSLVCTGISILLSSCVTFPPPVQEYALARSAMDAARAVDAARYSPGHWGRAELAFKNAQNYYQEREYQMAQGEFINARAAAEKAENSARLIRHKNGEVM